MAFNDPVACERSMSDDRITFNDPHGLRRPHVACRGPMASGNHMALSDPGNRGPRRPCNSQQPYGLQRPKELGDWMACGGSCSSRTSRSSMRLERKSRSRRPWAHPEAGLVRNRRSVRHRTGR